MTVERKADENGVFDLEQKNKFSASLCSCYFIISAIILLLPLMLSLSHLQILFLYLFS